MPLHYGLVSLFLPGRSYFVSAVRGRGQAGPSPRCQQCSESLGGDGKGGNPQRINLPGGTMHITADLIDRFTLLDMFYPAGYVLRI